jgi:RNA polymerase primary sigma factor
MFCSNLYRPLPDGKQRLRIIGRCDLPWHQVDSKPFAGPGWFGAANDSYDVVSCWENEALAKDLFLCRDGLGGGTTACVVSFHDPSSDTPKSLRELSADVEKATAREFFPAIAKGELSVVVETYEGAAAYHDRRPATSVEVDVRTLQGAFWHMLKAKEEDALTEQLEEAGNVVGRVVPLTVPSRTLDHPEYGRHGEMIHEALLLVRQSVEDEQSLNTMAMFRGPGMVVQTVDLKGICLGARPFHAMLLCGLAAGNRPADKAAEEFLRTAEPPSHNKWTATSELKAAYARGCIKKLDEFLSSAREAIRDLVKPALRDLGDGPKSLRELLRLGSEPVSTTRERPRVADQVGKVDELGRWNVDVQIRLKSSELPTRITPALLFVAETGSGQEVPWEKIEAVTNCTIVEDRHVVIPPRKTQASFRGISLASKHPVPAQESSVVVDLRKVTRLVGGEA